MINKDSAVQRSLPLYISAPQACEYLADEVAQNIFISPDVDMNAELYEHLLGVGFRRSGKFVYRPRCETCKECIPCRVQANQFRPSRSQKRVLSTNKDLAVQSMSAAFSAEHYELYLKYQRHKHPGGNMETFSEEAYEEFICQSLGTSAFLETRLDDKLLAVAVTDVFSNSLSAVYTFFDPKHLKRSLGTFSILKQIEKAQQLGKDYLYMGYYIEACSKMSYKPNFKPVEFYLDETWQAKIE
ncbi:MAG: arginyltransferase [Cycloclasticus sp. symbiont of Poecilosclerida sp. M]|nr:MAG: arginyltransferase [Cycloclasticus sp. symbiont of Poecilosclerida sp. M]